VTESTDRQHPDCVCDHQWADHQQPVDLGGDCDLCDCAVYAARGILGGYRPGVSGDRKPVYFVPGERVGAWWVVRGPDGRLVVTDLAAVGREHLLTAQGDRDE